MVPDRTKFNARPPSQKPFDSSIDEHRARAEANRLPKYFAKSLSDLKAILIELAKPTTTFLLCTWKLGR
jgi:hypothetical protein